MGARKGKERLTCAAFVTTICDVYKCYEHSCSALLLGTGSGVG
jgi:hypothetical protein